jgi:hypothetical protein
MSGLAAGCVGCLPDPAAVLSCTVDHMVRRFYIMLRIGCDRLYRCTFALLCRTCGKRMRVGVGWCFSHSTLRIAAYLEWVNLQLPSSKQLSHIILLHHREWCFISHTCTPMRFFGQQPLPHPQQMSTFAGESCGRCPAWLIREPTAANRGRNREWNMTGSHAWPPQFRHKEAAYLHIRS